MKIEAIDVFFEPKESRFKDLTEPVCNILFIGDSQIEIYRGFGIAATLSSGKTIWFKVITSRTPDIEKSLVVGENGEIRIEFLKSLLQSGIFNNHCVEDGYKPVLVFSAGSNSLNKFLYSSKIIEGFDFDLPNSQIEVDPSLNFLPFRLVEQLAKQYFQELRLRDCLSLLKERGVVFDYFLGPPPVHLDDEFLNKPGGPFHPSGRQMPIIKLTVRAKMQKLFSDFVEEACDGLVSNCVIDWQWAMEGLGHKREYELDGLHPNRYFARDMLRRMVTEILMKRALIDE